MLNWSDCKQQSIKKLLSRYDVIIKHIDNDKEIPGSFWGDSEAGIIKNELWVRNDTPVHSLLHEVCHYICMDQQRRTDLDTDAGGDYDEENGVCYLQILLADRIDNYSSESTLSEMDEWGYSFRLGSAKAWFENDSDDAHNWLVSHNILTGDRHITFNLRGA